MPVADRSAHPPEMRSRDMLVTALVVAALASLPARAFGDDDADIGATPSPVPGTDTPAHTKAIATDEAVDATPAPTPKAVQRSSASVAATGAQTGSRPLDLSPATLRKAIADAKEPEDDIAIARDNVFGTGKPTGQARIDQSFRDADIPTCMTPEAFKFDPPHFGPIYFGGFLAAPFLFHAIVTGKCRD